MKDYGDSPGIPSVCVLRVPKGCSYRVDNILKSCECVLYWFLGGVNFLEGYGSNNVDNQIIIGSEVMECDSCRYYFLTDDIIK